MRRDTRMESRAYNARDAVTLMGSIAVLVREVPLLGKGLHWINSAPFVGSARARHALLVGGKPTVAGVTRLASLEAIIVLHDRRGRCRVRRSENCHGRNGCQSCERETMVHR